MRHVAWMAHTYLLLSRIDFSKSFLFSLLFQNSNMKDDEEDSGENSPGASTSDKMQDAASVSR